MTLQHDLALVRRAAETLELDPELALAAAEARARLHWQGIHYSARFDAFLYSPHFDGSVQ